MLWQILLSLFLLLNATGSLLRRYLAKRIPQHNRFINWVFFSFILWPCGLIAAAFMHPDLAIGWQTFWVLLAGELAFPVANLLIFHASRRIDAGSMTILSNLTPIVTIVTAWLWLNEILNGQQLLGAAVIIMAAIAACFTALNKRFKVNAVGLVTALLGVAIVGLAITFERYLLTRMDLGAYLIYGWGAQACWMSALAWRERKSVKILRKKSLALPILAYGLSKSLQGLCFIGAVYNNGNVSLVSAFSSFSAVLVVIAAFLVLKERDWLGVKLAAAGAGILGLILLNS